MECPGVRRVLSWGFRSDEQDGNRPKVSHGNHTPQMSSTPVLGNRGRDPQRYCSAWRKPEMCRELAIVMRDT